MSEPRVGDIAGFCVRYVITGLATPATEALHGLVYMATEAADRRRESDRLAISQYVLDIARLTAERDEARAELDEARANIERWI